MSSLSLDQTHGGIAENLILPDEKQSGFDSLLNGLLDEYQPETKQHRIFVEQLAIAHWLLWRRQRASNAVETRVYENFPDPANWIDPEYRRLFLIERYKTAAERSLKRALLNAESIRKGRQVERSRLENQAKWRAEQNLREARHKLRQLKQRTAPPAKAEPACASRQSPPQPVRRDVPPAAALEE